MRLPPVRLLAAALLAFMCLEIATAAADLPKGEPPIIAKARAQLAPDAVLDAVQSIHYVGTLVSADPADDSKQVRQSIEIFLQKPARQRIVFSSADAIRIDALDGYDAWTRITDAKNPSKWQQSQMSADQIKQLRADVWQNLAYFRGIERIGGTIEDQGTVTIDGILSRKIAFIHNPTVVNYRYFNDATGELVYTGTPQYNTRERGELIVGGIRFAKSLLITRTGADGKPNASTLTFEKITVNETFPASLFTMPLPTVK